MEGRPGLLLVEPFQLGGRGNRQQEDESAAGAAMVAAARFFVMRTDVG
jgi:hypothetical protein